jgi:MFS superfamily sulfate permease-like transporter
MAVEVSGNLHYAAVAPFMEEMERIVPDGTRILILDLTHAREIRFAALRAMEDLAEEIRHDGGTLLLAGVDEDTALLLERSGSPLPFVPDRPTPGASVLTALAGFGGRSEHSSFPRPEKT